MGGSVEEYGPLNSIKHNKAVSIGRSTSIRAGELRDVHHLVAAFLCSPKGSSERQAFFSASLLALEK